jgi:hypothetical protein
MEQRGAHSENQVVTWQLSRLRVWAGLLLIAGLVGGVCIAMQVHRPDIAGPVLLLIVPVSTVFVLAFRYRSMRAEAMGVTFTSWSGRSRLVPRDKILGVIPKRSRMGSTELSVRGSRIRLELERLLLVPDTKDLDGAMVALYGPIPLPEDLQPHSPVALDVRARLERGETFEWRHRYRHVIGVFGIAAIGATALLLITIPFWLPRLIESKVTVVSMLSVTYAVMVIVSVAMLTCLDMLRGGPIVRIRADRNGLTLCRWWREETYLAADLQAASVDNNRGTHMVEVHATARPLTRTWQFMEKHWHTPRAELAAVLLHLFGASEKSDDLARPATDLTQGVVSAAPATA